MSPIETDQNIFNNRGRNSAASNKAFSRNNNSSSGSMPFGGATSGIVRRTRSASADRLSAVNRIDKQNNNSVKQYNGGITGSASS